MLLGQPVGHDRPWPWFSCEQALPEPWCAALERLFDAPVDWRLQHGGFYECWMAVVTDRLDPAWRAPLVARMAELTGVPLAPTWRATLQRMDPGQHALVHTDRPLVGYEAVRLVVQLNRAWRPEDGGWFEVFDPTDLEVPAVRVAPQFDTAVGFVMRSRSHHAVSPAHTTRRTVVLHFWHAANTEAFAAEVDDLFDGMRVDALPDALDPVMLDAEQRHPDEVTLHAAATAWALHRWGLPPATAVAGYRAALAGDPTDPVLALAAWAARLRYADFDVDAWERLRERVRGAGLPGGARRFARVSVGPGEDG